MVAFDITMIPQTVIDAWWALILAVVFAATAYLQKLGKDEAVETTKEVIDYFDPTVKTSTTPPAVIPARTYQMSDVTKRYLTFDESPADQISILEQIAKAEENGQATYRITTSQGWYDIEYGLIKASGKGAKPSTP
jgi:hypothetical protein